MGFSDGIESVFSSLIVGVSIGSGSFFQVRYSDKLQLHNKRAVLMMRRVFEKLRNMEEGLLRYSIRILSIHKFFILVLGRILFDYNRMSVI